MIDDDGCRQILRLDNLENHSTTCIYHPYAEVTCDKGCNLKIFRNAYKANCLDHFRNKIMVQESDITTLKDEVHFQLCQKEIAEKVISDLREEMRKLTVTQERDEISKLSHAVVPSQVLQSDKLRISFNLPPNWHTYRNIKTQINEPSILEKDDQYSDGYVQSAFEIKPSRPYFKIYILKGSGCGSVTMGLTRKGQPYLPPGSTKASYGYLSDGTVHSRRKSKKTEDVWKVGDVITCGIKFPKEFYNGNTEVWLYFCRNDKEVEKYNLSYPSGGLFPTVYLKGRSYDFFDF